MPIAAKRPCCSAGCRGFAVIGGYCEQHQSKIRQKDKDRGSAHKRGYGAKWNTARLIFLDTHPLCCKCEANDRVVAANVVDHVIPHKGNQKLFWDQKNWQALCKPCHDTKTATEDRGSWLPNPNAPK